MMKCVVILAALVIGNIQLPCGALTSPNCPQGFTRIDGVCYGVFTWKKAWTDAKRSCIANGTFLAEPKSLQEHKNIVDLVKANGGGDTWIGLTNKGRAGRWVWDESETKVTFTNWAFGEPNNYGGVEDCVHLSALRGHNYKWNDVGCNQNYIFVCQKFRARESTTNLRPTTPKPISSLSWLTFNGKQYKDLKPIPLFWNKEESRERCKKEGAYLPKPMSEEENNYLKELSPHRRFYLGINDVTTEGQWRYDDDETPVMWTGWAVTEPDNHGYEMHADCVVVTNFRYERGWYDIGCTKHLASTVICERRAIIPPTVIPPTIIPPTSCTGGFVYEGDLCYLYVDRADTWHAATIHCRSLDAFLAEPRTQGQIQFLKNLSSKKHREIWLGGTDETLEGKWVWAHSGADVDEPNDWMGVQPDDFGPGEDCLEISDYKGRWRWNDVPCDEQKDFVCQKEMNIVKNDDVCSTTTAETTTALLSRCRDRKCPKWDGANFYGWTRFKALNGKDAQLPRQCAEVSECYRCKFIPFWRKCIDNLVWLDLSDKYPATGGQVTGRICVTSQGGDNCTDDHIDEENSCDKYSRINCCKRSFPVTVKNCGDYLIYHMEPQPNIYLQYCVEPFRPPKTYGIYYTSDESRRWKHARLKCLGKGGILAEPRTEWEHHHIASKIRAQYGSTHINFWIGLSRLDVNKGMLWQDGVSLSSLDWNRFKDGLIPRYWKGECVYIYHIANRERMYWHAVYCDGGYQLKGYICEFSGDGPSSVSDGGNLQPPVFLVYVCFGLCLMIFCMK